MRKGHQVEDIRISATGWCRFLRIYRILFPFRVNEVVFFCFDPSSRKLPGELNHICAVSKCNHPHHISLVLFLHQLHNPLRLPRRNLHGRSVPRLSLVSLFGFCWPRCGDALVHHLPIPLREHRNIAPRRKCPVCLVESAPSCATRLVVCRPFHECCNPNAVGPRLRDVLGERHGRRVPCHVAHGIRRTVHRELQGRCPKRHSSQPLAQAKRLHD